MIIKQLNLLIILTLLSCSVWGQGFYIELNQNHLIASKSISVFGGLTKKGNEISAGLTSYSKSLSGLNKGFYFSYSLGDINTQTGTDFQNIAVKVMLEKTVFQSKSMFINLGAGPYLGFEKLKNSVLDKTRSKDFVPGLTGFFEFEDCFSSGSRWGVFLRAEQTYRYSSDISSLYYSVNLGVRYSLP